MPYNIVDNLFKSTECFRGFVDFIQDFKYNAQLYAMLSEDLVHQLCRVFSFTPNVTFIHASSGSCSCMYT